jgi:mannonate dehydratase
VRIADRLFLQGSSDRETLAFLRQMGAEGVFVNIAGELRGNAVGTPAVPRELADRLRSGPHWTVDDLVALRRIVEGFGLELCSLAHTPPHRYQKALYGSPGRDEEIEHWCRSLDAMGRAGIPVLQYFWHANAGSAHINWHTSVDIPIRGGALAEGFDQAAATDEPITEHGRVVDDQLWESLAYFLKGVIPAAERAGVRMAMHPADPQVPSLAGIARIMRSPEAFDRMLDIVPSDANAMVFCQGCFAQMLDAEGVHAAIERYVSRGAAAFVHFRNVGAASTRERFTESFWDEGKIDMVRAMRTYAAHGYTGFLSPDHHPHVVGDTAWGHRSRAFALGYMRGLVQSVAGR